MRIRELLIVEGKYDAAKLSGLVDGLILTTDGFSIYRDREKRELIREMGKKRGKRAARLTAGAPWVMLSPEAAAPGRAFRPRGRACRPCRS